MIQAFKINDIPQLTLVPRTSFSLNKFEIDAALRAEQECLRVARLAHMLLASVTVPPVRVHRSPQAYHLVESKILAR